MNKLNYKCDLGFSGSTFCSKHEGTHPAELDNQLQCSCDCHSRYNAKRCLECNHKHLQ